MIYFLSDIHLGSMCVGNRREHEQRIVDFLNSIRDDAEEIYLLGDILDYWYEYRYVVPRGYVRFFGALAAMSDAGVKITWLTGNHDIWMFDYLSSELGLEVIDRPYIERIIKGKKFILSHGDRIGKQKLSFKFICWLFRNKICQKMYAAIHPRWTIPFATNWSSHSRKSGNFESLGTEEHKKAIVDSVMSIPEISNVDYVVIGHHHVMLEHRLEGLSTKMFVLGDWLTHDSYGTFDGESFELHSLKNKLK